MQNVLADLSLEVEAATALALRLARGFDEAPHDARERKFIRLATAVGKYWVTKRCPAVVGEALECLGGNGYVEDGPLARLYRDAPLNSIWEGTGNVQCLDVLRAIRKDPESLDILLEEIEAARSWSPGVDSFLFRLSERLEDEDALETHARWITESLAVGLQAALLVQHAPAEVSDAYCGSRLMAERLGFGTLPAHTAFERIIARAQGEA